MIKVHKFDMPSYTTLDVNPDFSLDDQDWYAGMDEDEASNGTVGSLPIPEPLPPLVQLAIGNVRNAPINTQVAMAWVLKTDERLIERFQKRSDEVKHNICKTCLGPNVMVDVKVLPNKGICIICKDRYDRLKWTPDTIDVRLKVRTKYSIICKKCAEKKDVCQTCLFDMKFGLPVEVRDKLLARTDGVIPSSIVKLLPEAPDYLLDDEEVKKRNERMSKAEGARRLSHGPGTPLLTLQTQGDETQPTDLLERQSSEIMDDHEDSCKTHKTTKIAGYQFVCGKISRPNKLKQQKSEDAISEKISLSTFKKVQALFKKKRSWQTFYQQNRAKICTFWMRGECGKGVFCEFRHEKPTGGEMVSMGLVPGVRAPSSYDSIRARYMGTGGDPVGLEMTKLLVGEGDDLLQGREEATRVERRLGRWFWRGVTRGESTIVVTWDTFASLQDLSLRTRFSRFGEVTSVRVAKGAGRAYIKFAKAACAAEAANEANGEVLEGVKISTQLRKPLTR
ncbi:hypothetical protein GUITHDRAFT_100724 [Guillardia theta CCMP2712]|uniref:Uncharacterized protein n=1 Tax=Guillardia theta (strain CCMP2712) TaxID=905079 RepID=L1K059_GUITC|nr:hypothetical protein GUITHDRAFT_100724 [Guillardia theta CCMP2712]EKX53753.1 hypothetical protein GUITHDRAFT_100724 [Guillardia theta CCMP2712]|eukprot:XP_005840733.1 hypothetical protein GUITHDRAFT_100724 [Guillardia theta CCMP2712]